MDLITIIFNEEFDKAKEYIFMCQPNLNYVSNTGDTPLLVAIDTSNIDMVEFLLKHGANPTI